MTPEIREQLRLQLLSLGADVVIAEARGSSDSAEDFHINAARYIMPGPDVRVEKTTREVKHPSGWVSQMNRITVWEKDKVIVDGESHNALAATATDGMFTGILDQYDEAVASLEVDVPPALQETLNQLLEYLVDSNLWWDFNDDGSYGEFAWDLRSNKAAIEGGYWRTETVPCDDADPLGIEAEA